MTSAVIELELEQIVLMDVDLDKDVPCEDEQHNGHPADIRVRFICSGCTYRYTGSFCWGWWDKLHKLINPRHTNCNSRIDLRETVTIISILRQR